VGDRRIVAVCSDDGGGADLWQIDTRSREWSRLTRDGSRVLRLGYDLTKGELLFDRETVPSRERRGGRWREYRVRPGGTPEPTGVEAQGDRGDYPSLRDARRLRFAPDGRARVYAGVPDTDTFPYAVEWFPDPEACIERALLERVTGWASGADLGHGTLYLLADDLYRVDLPGVSGVSLVAKIGAGIGAPGEVVVSEPLGLAVVGTYDWRASRGDLLLVSLRTGRFWRLGEGQSPDIWPRAWPAGHRPRAH
jgi:hypothetical protein